MKSTSFDMSIRGCYRVQIEADIPGSLDLGVNDAWYAGISFDVGVRLRDGYATAW